MESGFSAAAMVSRSWRSWLRVGAPAEHVVELLQEHLVREARGVGRGEQREEPPLVPLVVEDDLFVGVAARGELAALAAVGDRDLEADLRRRDGRAVERDAPLHQRAEHREEPAPRAVDGRRVRAVLGDVAVLVEQVGAGDAHLGEVQPPVVDTVQAALEAVVLAADAGEELAVGVADGHVERVHAVGDALGDQLGEHDRGPAVIGRVAEVVLPRRAERRVDDELLRLRIVGRRGADAGHIRPVTGLGHGERTGHLEAHDAGEVLLVVVLGAELHDGGAEEPPLHARLDLQRRVGRDELFEAGDVAAVVLLAADALRERLVHLPVLDEELQLLERARALVFEAEPFDLLHLRPARERARGEARIRPGAEQLPAELFDIDARGRRSDLFGCGAGGGFHSGVGRGFGARDGVNHEFLFGLEQSSSTVGLRFVQREVVGAPPTKGWPDARQRPCGIATVRCLDRLLDSTKVERNT